MTVHARALWADWSAPRAEPAPSSAHDSEYDVRDYLRALAKAFGTDEASLSLHSDEADADAAREIVIVGTAIPADLHARVATPRAIPAGAAPWFPAQAEPEWTTCMQGQRLWHVLQMPVSSRRARSRVILSLFLDQPSPAERVRALAALQEQRPLIESYLRLWQRMRAQARGGAGVRCALDCIETGVVLIDRKCRIVFANRSARELLGAGDPLRRSGDGFTACDIRQAVPLQVALSHALAANLDPENGLSGRRSAPILSLRSPRSGRSLVLTVVPAEECASEHHDVAAIVYMIDPSIDKAAQLRPICGLYGLSPVETRLVCLLTAGKTLQEAAETMRIKDQTARSYLKQVFLKTDTKRQADLVRLMLSSLLGMERTIEPTTFQLV